MLAVTLLVYVALSTHRLVVFSYHLSVSMVPSVSFAYIWHVGVVVSPVLPLSGVFICPVGGLFVVKLNQATVSAVPSLRLTFQ